MISDHTIFDAEHTLHELKHYLPSQAPLKDFVHHNTLHAFQKYSFHTALQMASEKFGFKVYDDLKKFRSKYLRYELNHDVFNKIISDKKGVSQLEVWKTKLLDVDYDTTIHNRLGQIRENWKEVYKTNLDKEVHPTLFRFIGSYLDQGIAIWKLPVNEKGILATVRNLQANSSKKLFKSKRVKELLFNTTCELEDLLFILVGDEHLYEQYLFDQQFAHPGWSGMVGVLESQPQSLLDRRNVSLKEFIAYELLLEIDLLDQKFGQVWKPLSESIDKNSIKGLFDKHDYSELFEVYSLWLEIAEWNYFDQVVYGLQHHSNNPIESDAISFQAAFCIDDRESTIRTYFEKEDPNCQTFGTAGFFNVECYFQPENAKFYTKVCPAPATPTFLIKESEAKSRHTKDVHFNKFLSGVFGGWVSTQTMGFWSGIKLAGSIFLPSESPAMVSSFKHMDPNGKLTYHVNKSQEKVDGLQVGFTDEEMANRMEALLKSIGLVKSFAPIVYFFGHGASSINNTHYAGYDCGACCGRAGSMNARAAAHMLNSTVIREMLAARSINIPETTQFVGALHDTTRDEVEYYDTKSLSNKNKKQHEANCVKIEKALSMNAKERARRFFLIDTKQSAKKVHDKVKLRSISLFEPRPEWNHSSNCLAIVGKRETNLNLFLDQRAFLNSYDYSIDPEGKSLLGILNAVAPVCGGINLEYYFSSVDNHRLGAGSKLPHNVMGLIGVANGMEGDLRPGLPKQMINIHDAIRLMVTVEHFPEVVLNTIKQNPSTYEWFINEWVILVVVHPETKTLYHFRGGKFQVYEPATKTIPTVENLEKLVESTREDLPVFLIR